MKNTEKIFKIMTNEKQFTIDREEVFERFYYY